MNLIKPAFVRLASFVATLLSSSCNTDEQKQPSEFTLDPKSMTTEFTVNNNEGTFYRRVMTDSSYYIEDTTGVLAERTEGGTWRIQNYAAALEAIYKIDSAFVEMNNNK